jgi:hypothetical protein
VHSEWLGNNRMRKTQWAPRFVRSFSAEHVTPLPFGRDHDVDDPGLGADQGAVDRVADDVCGCVLAAPDFVGRSALETAGTGCPGDRLDDDVALVALRSAFTFCSARLTLIASSHVAGMVDDRRKSPGE